MSCWRDVKGPQPENKLVCGLGSLVPVGALAQVKLQTES